MLLVAQYLEVILQMIYFQEGYTTRVSSRVVDLEVWEAILWDHSTHCLLEELGEEV
jgi:hypothetical protein